MCDHEGCVLLKEGHFSVQFHFILIKQTKDFAAAAVYFAERKTLLAIEMCFKQGYSIAR